MDSFYTKLQETPGIIVQGNCDSFIVKPSPNVRLKEFQKTVIWIKSNATPYYEVASEHTNSMGGLRQIDTIRLRKISA